MAREVCQNPEQNRKELRDIVLGAVRDDMKKIRIPIYSNAWTWKVCDAGYKLSEAMHDYDIMFDAVCQHHEKYHFDIYNDLGTRNPIRMAEAAGTCTYEINDEQNIISIRDRERMMKDEYDEFLASGHAKFCFEKVLPRIANYKSREEMFQKIADAGREQLAMGAYTRRINKQFRDGYGIPPMTGGRFAFPSDTLFSYLRGLRGISMDFRRNEKYILPALERIDEGNSIDKVLDSLPNPEDYCFAVRTVSLSHTLMNPKQFEKYLWPFMKKFIDGIVARDMTAFIWQEGNIGHLYEFFQEIPRGHFALLGELDDIREMKKKLPNLTMVGGMSESLLSMGTPQECIDYAKALIDDVGYDGRYIFSTNKMLSFANDARSENMRAVNDFVREYGVIK